MRHTCADGMLPTTSCRRHSWRYCSRKARRDPPAGAVISYLLGIARHRRRRRQAMLATAAVLIGFVFLVTWSMRGPVPSTTTQAAFIVATPEETVTDFLPLIYSNVPMAEGQLVRVELPRSALASFGLELTEPVGDVPAMPVLADVVVGEDGLARAVRFVRPAIYPIGATR